MKISEHAKRIMREHESAAERHVLERIAGTIDEPAWARHFRHPDASAHIALAMAVREAVRGAFKAGLGQREAINPAVAEAVREYREALKAAVEIMDSLLLGQLPKADRYHQLAATARRLHATLRSALLED